ncbi:MAG: hypothetical protein R6U19_00460 [Bacteroidales bacterium]
MPTLNNNYKYKTLREKFQVFSFDDVKVIRGHKQIKLTFEFNLDKKHRFRPSMTIKPNEAAQDFALSKKHLDQLAFHIGMIELISYWKAACPARVIIKPYKLDKKQIDFWKKIYYNGLGEFFHQNGIQSSRDDFMDIECRSDSTPENLNYLNTHNYIVPIGGGKDSIVTLQLLNNFFGSSKDITPFIMNPLTASLQTCLEAGFKKKDIFIIERRIDPLLLDLNDKGFLNGHTPFSALLAFSSLLVSAITRNRYIALSNESSANEATVPGTNINHQYSKSLEFENDFRAYVNTYISKQFEYFSFLRPLSEFQIAKIFSQYDNSFYSFRSCNAGSKQNKWCGKCPKCLFTFIILSPFVSKSTLEAIFGQNLLDDKEQEQNYLELTGQAAQKPFECVGTREEVNIALTITINKHYPAFSDMPWLLKKYKKTRLFKRYKNITDADWILHGLSENNLPEELADKLGSFLLKVYCK